jgi:hypothetical protein
VFFSPKAGNPDVAESRLPQRSGVPPFGAGRGRPPRLPSRRILSKRSEDPCVVFFIASIKNAKLYGVLRSPALRDEAKSRFSEVAGAGFMLNRKVKQGGIAKIIESAVLRKFLYNIWL